MAFPYDFTFTFDRATPADKIFVVDKEGNLFRVNPADLTEEKVLDIS